MTPGQFDSRLRILASLVGSEKTDDLFNAEYEAMLNEIKADDDKERQLQQAGRMRRLVDHQICFQVNQWLQANRQQGQSQNECVMITGV